MLFNRSTRRHPRNRRVRRLSVAERWQRYSRLAARTLVVLAVPLMVGGVGYALHALGKQLILHPRLQLHQIVIQQQGGAPLAAADRAQIMRVAEVHLGVPLLAVDLDTMAQKIRSYPWVQAVTVHRKLPDVLTIDVVMHTAAVMVALGQVYVADTNGHIFKKFSSAEGLALPVVTGLAALPVDGDELHQHLRTAVKLQVLAERSLAKLSRLEALHWDVDLGWSLLLQPQTVGQSFQVHLGHEPHHQLNVVRAAVEICLEQGKMPIEMWADGQKNPQRVALRWRQSAVAPDTSAWGGNHGTEG